MRDRCIQAPIHHTENIETEVSQPRRHSLTLLVDLVKAIVTVLGKRGLTAANACCPRAYRPDADGDRSIISQMQHATAWMAALAGIAKSSIKPA
jgi:hypothetical protein